MELTYSVYKDKVMGCWTGKNIGGVLGAPFEALRQVNDDVDFYTQDLSMGPPPNDDLDLQIIWLSAVERYGRNVNASILGEYWLSYCIPNWAEYGTGKANLRAGLVPPMSGVVDNTYKDSCGCFIRSEIWACLAPGNPELAARYAHEDAIVDHADDGMYGEVFFAALQSAAFVVSDLSELLNIGLSYIPEKSKLSQVIRMAVECKKKKINFYEARKLVHNTAPGTFGIQDCKLSEVKKEGNEDMETGAPGFDAPENIGFTILAWLYGEDDFGRSICLANACGEDADCTCATLGATMGIILGAKNLPKKWVDPLDDKIATLCIDRTSRGIWVPDTVTELAERVMRTTPLFLGQDLCDIFAEGGMTISCCESEDLYCNTTDDYLHMINGSNKPHDLPLQELCALPPYNARYEFTAFSVTIDCGGNVFFKKGEERTIRVKVVNSDSMRQQQWTRITTYMPTGIEMISAGSCMLPLNNLYGSSAECEFTFNTDLFEEPRLEFIIDISLVGRHSAGPVKVVLMRK